MSTNVLLAIQLWTVLAFDSPKLSLIIPAPFRNLGFGFRILDMPPLEPYERKAKMALKTLLNITCIRPGLRTSGWSL